MTKGKAGRPPSKNARKEQITVRMTTEEKQALKDEAELVGVDVAVAARMLIKEALRARQAHK